MLLTRLNLALRSYPSVPKLPISSRIALKITILPTGGGLDGRSPVLVRRGEAVAYSNICMAKIQKNSDRSDGKIRTCRSSVTKPL